MKSFAEEFGLKLTDQEMDLDREIPKEDEFCFLRDGQQFDLGDRTLEIIHTPGHTKGSVCVLDRQNRMLFSADTICDQGVLLFFDHSASVRCFRDSVCRLIERSGEYTDIWPGHHRAPIDCSWAEEYKECADAVIAAPGSGALVQSALGSGRQAASRRIAITYLEENI